MIKNRYLELAVGFLILLGIVAFSMLALQVSGLNQYHSNNNSYQVNIEFTNIGSLKERAKVSIGGVVVGRVTKISLDPVTYNSIVTVAMSTAYNIPEDTTASILTAGLLGDNYIGLNPGFSEDMLKTGDTIVMENTHSALVLEKLIDKFITNQTR